MQDITSQESIEQWFKILLHKNKGADLDILVNNAGTMIAGGVEETTIEKAYE